MLNIIPLRKPRINFIPFETTKYYSVDVSETTKYKYVHYKIEYIKQNVNVQKVQSIKTLLPSNIFCQKKSHK